MDQESDQKPEREDVATPDTESKEQEAAVAKAKWEEAQRLVAAMKNPISIVLQQPEIAQAASLITRSPFSFLGGESDSYDDVCSPGYRTQTDGDRDVQIDRPMLEQFFARILQLAEKYKKTCHLVKEYMQSRDKGLFGPIRKEFKEEVVLEQSDITAVTSFVAQARVAKQVRPSIRTQFESYTAVGLVLEVLRKLQNSWNMQLAELREGKQVGTAPDVDLSTWPAPEELIALIEEEKALVYLFLSEHPTQALDDPVQEKSDASNEPVDSRLKVERWSELGIGIDAFGYWALKPGPEFGERFYKSGAKKLALKSERWKTLFKLLAAAPGGDTVSRTDLVQEWGLFPTESCDLPNGLNDVDPDELSKLSSMAGTSLTRLNGVLTQLRERMLQLISGPTDTGQKCLETEGDFIVSRFRVAYLLANDKSEGGGVRFGDRRKPL